MECLCDWSFCHLCLSNEPSCKITSMVSLCHPDPKLEWAGPARFLHLSQSINGCLCLSYFYNLLDLCGTLAVFVLSAPQNLALKLSSSRTKHVGVQFCTCTIYQQGSVVSRLLSSYSCLFTHCTLTPCHLTCVLCWQVMELCFVLCFIWEHRTDHVGTVVLRNISSMTSAAPVKPVICMNESYVIHSVCVSPTSVQRKGSLCFCCGEYMEPLHTHWL